MPFIRAGGCDHDGNERILTSGYKSHHGKIQYNSSRQPVVMETISDRLSSGKDGHGTERLLWVSVLYWSFMGSLPLRM